MVVVVVSIGNSLVLRCCHGCPVACGIISVGYGAVVGVGNVCDSVIGIVGKAVGNVLVSCIGHITGIVVLELGNCIIRVCFLG
ncbi:MAG: hypothetical protein A4E71_01302 [Smithella sp. PtaU1.Bin162]|nr:MAG: hypothetical protein A4E71_01302 [Smithella sp. PtaU1.Bin162]